MVMGKWFRGGDGSEKVGRQRWMRSGFWDVVDVFFFSFFLFTCSLILVLPPYHN